MLCCACSFNTNTEKPLMDGMFKCMLEKGEKFLSERNTVLREYRTGPYITICNCA